MIMIKSLEENLKCIINNITTLRCSYEQLIETVNSEDKETLLQRVVELNNNLEDILHQQTHLLSVIEKYPELNRKIQLCFNDNALTNDELAEFQSCLKQFLSIDRQLKLCRSMNEKLSQRLSNEMIEMRQKLSVIKKNRKIKSYYNNSVN